MRGTPPCPVTQTFAANGKRLTLGGSREQGRTCCVPVSMATGERGDPTSCSPRNLGGPSPSGRCPRAGIPRRPVTRSHFPPEGDVVPTMRRFFGFLLETEFLPRALVFTTDDLAGVAAWLAPTRGRPGRRPSRTCSGRRSRPGRFGSCPAVPAPRT